ncbi:hypothetical protein MX319_001543 [Salmonella enterica]|nr:hypothetical protein [Salmonella enterica]EJC1098255.1 hypothetical protein [Salmonella enterica]EJC1113284.1 hypothetical protein [Salmonella enterica]EKP1721677.1 hypothetical protein [Salmonella enterica]EKP1726504.1 hypothetical protein [Salmonella enterica]
MTDKNKVVPISNKKLPKKDEDILNDIAKILSDSEDNLPHEKPSSIYYVDGSGNTIGNGNIVNSGTINLGTPIYKKKVVVKTGVGVIDANQKSQIQSILYEWVDTHCAIKKSSLSRGGAWSKFNRHFKINSYHELQAERFPEAIKWLRARLGTLKSMASAPKKLPDWRKKTITAIQSRCSELGIQGWRKDYMQRKFHRDSMTLLDDNELKQLYRTVMAKK